MHSLNLSVPKHMKKNAVLVLIDLLISSDTNIMQKAVYAVGKLAEGTISMRNAFIKKGAVNHICSKLK